MKFKGKVTKHGTGHKVLVPASVMDTEGLHENDEVMVDIIKHVPKKETFCRKCIHSRDCWIKATMLSKPGFSMVDLNERDQQLVIRASNNDCDLYEE